MELPPPQKFNPAKYGIDLSKLAVGRGIAHVEKQKYTKPPLYYTPAAAEVVIAIVTEWKAQNWTHQQINCRTMNTAPRTLRDKIRGGLAWLIDNADTPEVRSYYSTLNAEIRFSFGDNKDMLYMARNRNVLIAMAPRSNEVGLEYRAQFLAYLSNARLGEKWHKPGIILSDEDIEWFKNKLNEPTVKDYFVGFVKETEVKVIRAEVQKESGA